MVYDGSGSFRAEHLEALLDSGERVLWQGRPERGAYIRSRISPVSCFGVFFLGFSLFWTGMAIWMTWIAPAGQSPAPPFFKFLFPLFGLPFILVGSGLTFGGIITCMVGWKNVEYAVTNRRLLVRSGVTTVTTTATDLAAVVSVTVTGDEVGRVTFDTTGQLAQVPAAIRQIGAVSQAAAKSGTAVAFEAIANPQEVARIAEEAKRKLAGT